MVPVSTRAWALLAIVLGASACSRPAPPAPGPGASPSATSSTAPAASLVPIASASGTNAAPPLGAPTVASPATSAQSHPSAPASGAKTERGTGGCGPLPPEARTPCGGDIYSCPQWSCVNGKWVDTRPRRGAGLPPL
ncbi:MAG TPA: hypothetical protein VLM85_30040 [Polyangiaceae bacterium]|nr:hypothetical protein [Polyangiaceae bacterium]